MMDMRLHVALSFIFIAGIIQMLVQLSILKNKWNICTVVVGMTICLLVFSLYLYGIFPLVLNCK